MSYMEYLSLMKREKIRKIDPRKKQPSNNPRIQRRRKGLSQKKITVVAMIQMRMKK
jgi:hypothetical protein